MRQAAGHDSTCRTVMRIMRFSDPGSRQNNIPFWREAIGRSGPVMVRHGHLQRDSHAELEGNGMKPSESKAPGRMPAPPRSGRLARHQLVASGTFFPSPDPWPQAPPLERPSRNLASLMADCHDGRIHHPESIRLFLVAQLQHVPLRELIQHHGNQGGAHAIVRDAKALAGNGIIVFADTVSDRVGDGLVGDVGGQVLVWP